QVEIIAAVVLLRTIIIGRVKNRLWIRSRLGKRDEDAPEIAALLELRVFLARLPALGGSRSGVHFPAAGVEKQARIRRANRGMRIVFVLLGIDHGQIVRRDGLPRQGNSNPSQREQSRE